MRNAPLRSPASGRRRRVAIAAALALAALTASCTRAADPGIRPPAVAGSFYPDDPSMLRRAVRFYLDDAVKGPVDAPRVLVAPHAGYLYSGQIAADAWAQAADEEVETIFLLGTNHTVRPFDGASVWYAGAFRTPLGDAAVDEAAARRLMDADPRFRFLSDAHEKEHSVEVQVPFAQVLFPDAKIVPVVEAGAVRIVDDRVIVTRLAEGLHEGGRIGAAAAERTVAAIPGMIAERADVMLAGALIVKVLARRAGVDEVRVSARGLRHGVLADFASDSLI